MDFVTDIPPRQGAARTDWQSVVAECKKHRGKFGLVGEFSVSVASQIRQGAIQAFLPRPGMTDEQKRRWMKDNWQIEYRRVEGKAPTRADLYVRFIG